MYIDTLDNVWIKYILNKKKLLTKSVNIIGKIKYRELPNIFEMEESDF